MKREVKKCENCLYASDILWHTTVGEDMIRCTKPRKRGKNQVHYFHKELCKCRDWKPIDEGKE